MLLEFNSAVLSKASAGKLKVKQYLSKIKWDLIC